MSEVPLYPQSLRCLVGVAGDDTQTGLAACCLYLSSSSGTRRLVTCCISLSRARGLVTYRLSLSINRGLVTCSLSLSDTQVANARICDLGERER
jgi:hypothetical protein